MKLQEARVAKSVILASVLEKLALFSDNPLSIPHVFRLTQARPPVPVLGLGVALGRDADDHKIAVRVMRHGFQFDLIRQLLAEFDPAHLDLRIIGRVYAAGKAVTGGSSLSHYLAGTGTLGCQVYDRAGGAPLLLSNNHVIAYANEARLDDAIVQPGEEEGGVAGRDTIGLYHHCVAIDYAGATNFVDAAVARLAADTVFQAPADPAYRYDPKAVPRPLTRMETVMKMGRSTGLTRGRVSAVDVDNLWVDYEVGSALFSNQLEVSGVDGPFAQHGDSGALVTDVATGAAVGLLFAVSERGTAYVNPIGPVLTGLNVSLTP